MISPSNLPLNAKMHVNPTMVHKYEELIDFALMGASVQGHWPVIVLQDNTDYVTPGEWECLQRKYRDAGWIATLVYNYGIRLDHPSREVT